MNRLNPIGPPRVTPQMPMHIRPETPDDHDAIRQVVTAAFGQADEADLVDALRAQGYARLSLVAENEGRIAGHILFSALPIHTERGVVDSLALAPVAVVPELQNQGIGSALIREGLQQSRAMGFGSVVVLGHANYYPRFGFSVELARPLQSPYAGDHFMALELVPGALAGVTGRVAYPPPFGGT